jgi:hypothetical protein
MLTERGGATGATGPRASAPIEVPGLDREPGVLVIGASGASRHTTGAALIEITSIRAPTLAPTMRGVG